MALSVQGGLAFTVDGPAGTTGGQVVGDGAVLRVRADDPAAAWDAAVGSVSTGPRGVRVLAEALADQGLSVEVSGPRGRLALLGAEAHSRTGAVLTGSSHVQPGGLAALRPLAVAGVRRSLTPRRRLGLVAAVLAVLGLRRTRRRGA